MAFLINIYNRFSFGHVSCVFFSLERLEDEFYNCVRAVDVASFGDIIELSFMIYFIFSSALSDWRMSSITVCEPWMLLPHSRWRRRWWMLYTASGSSRER